MRTYCRVRIFSHKAVVRYSQEHPDAAASLDTWYRTTLRADWRSFIDVRAVFPGADRVGRKYVFNVARNRYRLITEIDFKHHSVFIGRLLTHAEYDRGGWQS